MKTLRVWFGTPLLWQLAYCQNVPSAPAVEDFGARREPAITILNDHLYITGGRFSQYIDGEIAMNGNSAAWPLNDTLSISLKESWVNGEVQFKVTNQMAPSFSKAAFWRDPNQQTAYLWGGWAVPGTLPEARELWQFTADDDGGGEWSRPDPANSDKLAELARTTAASAATCNGKALYLGGFQNNNTDSRRETHSRVPIPGLVTYDMETRTWKNVSASPGFNNYGTSIYGAAACAENFGQNGLFFPISGHVSDGFREFNAYENGQFLIDTGELKFYDVEANRWYAQQTSGDKPDPRDRHCVAGVAGPNGTYDIYMYGGNDFREDSTDQIKSDLYVLSLPGFVWFQANTTSEPRSSHACVMANNGQMIVVGGTGAGGANFTIPDVWPNGLAVLDLHTLRWRGRYDAEAGEYEPPQAITDWYANGGLDSVEWNDDDVKALFVTSDIDNQDNGDTSSSSRGPIIGGVVGGVLGAVLAVGAIWFFVRRRRRQRRQQQWAASGFKPTTPAPSDNHEIDPSVSQNYQHYAIELNDSSVPYQKQQPSMGNGPYEMDVEHKPHETVSGNLPLEMGAETPRHELPAR